MKGSFTFDVLIGLLLLSLLSGPLFTSFLKFKDVFASASCSYLKDLYTSEQNLASSLGFSLKKTYSSGEVFVDGGNISVLGVNCR